MPMDPQLAAIYGNNIDGEDTEKLAAAELAEKLAADGDAEVEYTEEQIQELAAAALGEETEEEEQQAAGEETEEGAAVTEPEEAEKTSAAEEAKEKIAEADYLGRVMAHAYTNELRKIAAEQEKTAGKVGDFAKGVKDRVKSPDSKVGSFLRRHGRTMAEGAGGAAALKAGHMLGKRSKNKKASAEAQEPTPLDILAAQRAEEILKANGIELEQEAEKTSASEAEQAALAAAVDQRAMQMLQEAGYVEEQAEEQAEEK